MSTTTIAVVFGTRPEGVKMVPVVKALQAQAGIRTVTISTGQHRQMLKQVLSQFKIKVDYEMGIMEPNQSLYRLSAKAITAFEKVLVDCKPDFLLVQGDTTTAFLGALCAFYSKIPVGHVEAGLRTGNRYYPFPEEINRRLITVCADLYFAPTEGNRKRLIDEGVPKEAIVVTGNTGIDTLLMTIGRKHPFPLRDLDLKGKRLILITLHRRESLGETMRGMFKAIADIAHGYPDCEFVYPVHLNPKVHEPAREILGSIPNVHLTEPMEYFDFVKLMQSAFLILTDSGGIQEEAPTLGIPVMVLRNETERPEAVEAGTVRLTGTSREQIVADARMLLDNEKEREKLRHASNPYGDGHAAERIVDSVRKFLGI
jgi:UDP-N-acetylglucosamine 2-epimerase (non-hydrolysing)